MLILGTSFTSVNLHKCYILLLIYIFFPPKLFVTVKLKIIRAATNEQHQIVNKVCFLVIGVEEKYIDI